MATILLIAAAGVQPAVAALIEDKFLLAGDGLITRDDATGFEWLDLTVTTDLSPNDVLGGALDLLTIHGFRYALRGEIDAPYLSQGITLDVGFTTGNEPGAGNLMALMGCTLGCSGNFPTQEGFMEPGSLAAGFAHFQYIQQDLAAGTATAVFGAAFTDFDRSEPAIGHYLLRESQVPEPAALALFGLGLAALGMIGRRRRR